MSSTRRTAAIALVALLAIAGCGSSAEESAEGDAVEPTTAIATTAPIAPPAATVAPAPTAVLASAADPATPVSTLAGVEAAQWSSNVTITIGDGVFRFESNGLPSHELPDQYLVPTGQPGDANPNFVVADTAELITESPIDIEIPLNPVYSDEVTPTTLGTVGVVISGAPLFNDYEDMNRSIVALDDNSMIDGAYFIDACNGHPLANGSSYHYHGIPVCVTDTIDIAGQHSAILGFVRDGFPFYGDKNVDGSAITDDELDECGGHVGPTPEFPAGIYHYHLTGDSAPYSIDCYHGVVDDDAGQGAPPGGGGPPQGAGGPPAPGAAPGGAGGDAASPPPADDSAGDNGTTPAGGAPAGGGGAGGGAPDGGGGGVDLAGAAATLGVTVEALEQALGGPPPDFEAAAAILGVSVDALRAALPTPGQ